MNIIKKKDCDFFLENFQFANELDKSTFLITGATGLIGSTLVSCLLSLSREIKIYCPIRNIDKAKEIYGVDYNKINFIECELVDYLNTLTAKDKFKYIIHCASPTAGSYIISNPVQTYELAIDSTRLLLDHSRLTRPHSMVYVSSLEYYGQNFDDNIITEEMLGYVDYCDPRSSYPLSKRACEFLVNMYARQFGVNVMSARLTQTFGAGVSYNDNRVFAQFAKSIIEERDIVLHTTGESSKPYCYTIDCVSALLYILLKGKRGNSYNVANPKTYISIRSMAEFVRKTFNPNIQVVLEEHPELGYAPVTKLNLSVKKLQDLGWEPHYDLIDMYNNLIESLKYERNFQY